MNHVLPSGSLRINDSTCVVGRTHPARQPAALITAGTVAAAVLALFAACSGGSSSGSGGSPSASGSSSAGAIDYAACMRSHAVPKYPDPDAHGNLTKAGAQQLGVSTSQFQAAQRACQHLLPTGGSFEEQARQCTISGSCPPVLVRQMMDAGRRFARCMRCDGVPMFPDPKLGGPYGDPMFPVSEAGLSHDYTHSSQFRAIADECEHIVGANVVPFG